MSLRVSDLQVLMLRSQDVGKIQQVQQGNESAQQQGFADGLVRQSEIARQTVQTMPETEQGKVDGDRAKREREDTPRKESDQQQPEKDEAEKLASPFVGTIIDCKI
ncbi:MAG: hypothetical protein ABSA82_04845 [Thermacetogeniaceae bacterium]